jgi:hypothetical protein
MRHESAVALSAAWWLRRDSGMVALRRDRGMLSHPPILMPDDGRPPPQNDAVARACGVISSARGSMRRVP